MFCVSFVAYCLFREWYITNFNFITFTILCVMNIVALFCGCFYIKARHLLYLNLDALKPLVYKGSVIFMLCTLGQSMLSYLNINFGKIFVGNLNGLGQLGYYQAILHIVFIVEIVPNFLGNVTIPYFSAIFKSKNAEDIRLIYSLVERCLILFIGTAVFCMIASSKMILALYGGDYMNYYRVLIVLLASKLLASRGFMNTPMLVNLDKNAARLINSILQVSLQLCVMFFMIPRFGIYGAVAAQVLSAVFAQFIPQLIVAKSIYAVKSSRPYYVGVILVSLVTIINIYFSLSNMMIIGSTFIAYIIFIVLSGYSLGEMRKILFVIKSF